MPPNQVKKDEKDLEKGFGMGFRVDAEAINKAGKEQSQQDGVYVWGGKGGACRVCSMMAATAVTHQDPHEMWQVCSTL